MSGGWGSYTEQLHDIYEQLAGINWALRNPDKLDIDWPPGDLGSDLKPASGYWSEGNIQRLLQQRDTALEDAAKLRAKLEEAPMGWTRQAVEDLLSQRNDWKAKCERLERQLQISRANDEHARDMLQQVSNIVNPFSK